MKYSEMRSTLKLHGFLFLRYARGTHEIWRSEKRTILVSRNGLKDSRARANWLSELRRLSV